MIERDWGVFRLYHGDNLQVLRAMPDASVDSIVTDPPYGLAFMGKKWDYEVPPVETWAECLRVLKPGGHLLAFAGTRTQHRMAVRIEDAGFEIRDMLAWVYGSGFPKSLDVSKALDKAAGAERGPGEPGPYSNRRPRAEVKALNAYADGVGSASSALITNPATDAARQWEGWGTALKPAFEPITMARKPLIGTVAANVLVQGVGGLNIDGARVPSNCGNETSALGRWPANLIHDGSDEVLAAFPQAPGQQGPIRADGLPRKVGGGAVFGSLKYPTSAPAARGDGGSAARFFYCAKASPSDRGKGNNHPTVKPTDLMRYLVTLVTPPGGLVLDPWMGSGSTGKAAVAAGFRFVGIDCDDWLDVAARRIAMAAWGVA